MAHDNIAGYYADYNCDGGYTSYIPTQDINKVQNARDIVCATEAEALAILRERYPNIMQGYGYVKEYGPELKQLTVYDRPGLITADHETTKTLLQRHGQLRLYTYPDVFKNQSGFILYPPSDRKTDHGSISYSTTAAEAREAQKQAEIKRKVKEREANMRQPRYKFGTKVNACIVKIVDGIRMTGYVERYITGITCTMQTRPGYPDTPEYTYSLSDTMYNTNDSISAYEANINLQEDTD
jgi:hypothetical protein